LAVALVLMSSTEQYPIGHRIIRLDSVDSTNNYAAKLLLSDDLPHGSVIMADEQTAGKGQRGASWLENLLFTVILKPVNLSIIEQFKLTQFASLSVFDLLTKYDIKSAIKWPNDIYVDDSKICGMLIENQVSSLFISNILLGIGLNVNQNEFSELQATSLVNKLGSKIPIMDVAMSLCHCLNERWKLIENRQFDELNDDYHEQLYLRNIPSLFSDEQGEFSGTIINTTETGLLNVEGRNNEIRSYDLKEIRFVRRNAPSI
jgi:BirA family biotin operon repressor/biotin-[acetyl-CoA-carboxylase] ligase